jgi:hypothetical protein
MLVASQIGNAGRIYTPDNIVLHRQWQLLRNGLAVALAIKQCTGLVCKTT